MLRYCGVRRRNGGSFAVTRRPVCSETPASGRVFIQRLDFRATFWVFCKDRVESHQPGWLRFEAASREPKASRTSLLRLQAERSLIPTGFARGAVAAPRGPSWTAHGASECGARLESKDRDWASSPGANLGGGTRCLCGDRRRGRLRSTAPVCRFCCVRVRPRAAVERHAGREMRSRRFWQRGSRVGGVSCT